MRTNGDERRRYPRSRRALPQIVQDDGPGVLNHVDNISANGVLCHTVKPIPLMTKMSIALDLPKPEGHRIECEGVVVRCEPHDVGDDHFKAPPVVILLGPSHEDIGKPTMDFQSPERPGLRAPGEHGGNCIREAGFTRVEVGIDKNQLGGLRHQ